MSYRGGAVIGLLFSCWTMPHAHAAEENLNSVIKQAIQAFEKHKSVTATMIMQSDAGSGARSMTNLGKGTYEHIVVGAVLKYRMDLDYKLITATDNNTVEIPQGTISIICDGRNFFRLTDNFGEKEAIKDIGRANQSLAACPDFFVSLAQDNNVKLLPDEKHEGKDVWVIEARPKNFHPGQVAKTVYYILKDCGLRVKSTGHDASGARIQLSLLSDIKLDPPIKPERFVFRAPSGVQIVDLSKPR